MTEASILMIQSMERFTVLFAGLAVALAGACRKDEPPTAFNRNLGDDDVRLLPMNRTLLAAHDPSILQGQTRAEFTRHDEEVTDATSGGRARSADVSGGQPAGGQGSGSGSLLGALASAFVGGGGGAPPPATATGTPSGSAPSSQQASPAVLATVTQYNRAVGELNFLPLLDFHVSAHRPQAKDFYKRYNDLTEPDGIVEVLADTVERNEAGGGDKVRQRWKEYVIANLTIQPGDVPFTEEDGQQRIDVPIFTSPASLNPFMSAFTSLEDRIGEIESDLADGSISATDALDQFDQVLTQIAPTIKH